MPSVELSPLLEPSVGLVGDLERGDLEDVVLKDRGSPHRGGTPAAWSKVKDRSWYEREAWRFERTTQA